MKYFFLFTFLTFAAACSSDGDTSDGCTEYCDIVGDNCRGENALYEDTDQCLEVCAEFVDRPTADGATTGNTLQCRIYHAGAAIVNSATHCQHASVTSTPDTCQDTQSVCDTYCGEYFETCIAEFTADFDANLQTCINECPTTLRDEGTPTADDTADTLNCRISQLSKKFCDGGKVESEVCIDPVD